MSNKKESHYEKGMRLMLKAYSTKKKEAFQKYFRQAIPHIRHAAYAGNPKAQFELGLQYEDTGFLRNDMKRAMYWYEKAASNGHAEACNNIGFNYDHGIDVNGDVRKAVFWYKKGAQRGSTLAKTNLAKSSRKKSNKGK